MSLPPNQKENEDLDLCKEWNLCDSGPISQMLQERKRQERRDALRRIGVTSIGIFTVLGGVTLWQASRQPTLEERRRSLIIPISCEGAMNQLAYYHRDELDDGTMRRITHHLKRCKPCKIRYEKTYDIEFV